MLRLELPLADFERFFAVREAFVERARERGFSLCEPRSGGFRSGSMNAVLQHDPGIRSA
jgi:hypothetical protein